MVMPAAAVPLAAAERRRSFEEFLGIGEAPGRACRPHRKARCPRGKAKAHQGKCNLRGEWTQLPENTSIICLQKLHSGHSGWPASVKAHPLWPTSFEAHGDDDPAVLAGLMSKRTAIFLGIAAVSGGAGFVAALAMPPRATAEQLAEDQETASVAEGQEAILATPAAPAVPSTTLGTLAAAAADAGPAAIEEPEAPAEAAGPSAEEIARLEQIHELETLRMAATEKYGQLLTQKEERKLELQPSLDEVDVELRELEEVFAVEEFRSEAQAAQQGVGVDIVIDPDLDRTLQHGKTIYDHIQLPEGEVQRILDQRVASLRERVPQIVTEELNFGVNDLTSALEEPLSGPGAAGDMDDLPALSLMIAGLAAPTQLNMQHRENLSRLSISAALLAIDVLALGLGWDYECVTWIWGHQGRFLKAWLAVDAASLAFNVAVRILAMASVNKSIAKMQEFQEAPLDIPREPGMAFKVQLQRRLVIGAQAMVQYDKLLNTPAYRMLDGLAAFDFIWQFGGIALLFDTPSQFCHSVFLMNWARIRGVVFLIAAIPALLSLLFTIAKALVSSRGVSMALLKAASSIDQTMFPDGPCIATLLVRAFLVRDTTDMQAMETQVMEFEKLIADQARDRLKREYDTAASLAAQEEEKYAAQREIVRVKSKEEEFMTQYKEAVDNICSVIQLASEPGVVVSRSMGEMAASVSERTASAKQHPGALAPTAPPMIPTGLLGSTGDDDGGDGGTGSSLLGDPPSRGVPGTGPTY